MRRLKSGVEQERDPDEVRSPSIPLTAVVYAPMVEMVDGKLRINLRASLTPQCIGELAQAALLQPYIPKGDPDNPDPEDLALIGRPCVEVMLIKMAQKAARGGSPAQVTELLSKVSSGAFSGVVPKRPLPGDEAIDITADAWAQKIAEDERKMRASNQVIEMEKTLSAEPDADPY